MTPKQEREALLNQLCQTCDTTQALATFLVGSAIDVIEKQIILNSRLASSTDKKTAHTWWKRAMRLLVAATDKWA